MNAQYCLFITPSNHQNKIGFLMFFDSVKRQHWEVMGYKRLCLKILMKGHVKKSYVQKY